MPPALRSRAAGVAQVGVLPWRKRKGVVEVCLVTSRGTGRWIVPKGWLMAGRTPAEAAAIEAWEEAGLKGTVSEEPLGIYEYVKQSSPTRRSMVALLFAMRVRDEADKFPERRDRKRIWLKPKKAAARLDDPELARLVRRFSPSKPRR